MDCKRIDMNASAEVEKQSVETCGVVMPISSIDNCTEAHWSDVRTILFEAIRDAGFDPNLVSDADDVGIIQKRIIQNLYQNPIVVCDVSAKNPNVMFELGIRLAFDKPTIIVKDDKTSYSFDTSPIEHLSYPRDLRFSQIVEFKTQLSNRIKSTLRVATTDPNYTTFLKHFGTFSVAKLDSKEVTGDELILAELKELRAAVSSRPYRRELESSLIGGNIADTRFAEAMDRLSYEIRQQVKLRSLTTKDDIRGAKDDIRAQLELSIGPVFFRGPAEFEAFFNTAFAMLYG
jgi:hypothetical protein